MYFYYSYWNCYSRVHKSSDSFLKTQKTHFLPVLELMSDSLTARYIEPYQCPSHQSIILTQGPVHEIFMKKYWELADLENEVFWGGHFEFSKLAILDFFLLHISEKPSPFIRGIIFFCTMDGFSRILEKKGGWLLCTRLYIRIPNIYKNYNQN